MNFLVTFISIFTLLILRINGVEESKWKLTGEDIAQIEKQMQLRKNHTVKTIRTRHGDLYDCVEFHKQPAFDHPLLKNQNLTLTQKPPTSSHDSKLGLKGGGCPDGTVPIKRITKEDLLRFKFPQQISYDQPSYARCSTQVNEAGYSGTSASMVTYNPMLVKNDQFSAAVMRLHIGFDTIEAGWRADSRLYKDFRTHFYIHTNTRTANCFNVLCPGFVITGKNIPLDLIIDPISTPGGGGHRYGFDLSITHVQETRSWVLKFTGGYEIGYWPGYLFQQPGLADYVQWGGEVFSKPGSYQPGMGSGLDVESDTTKDAYFSHIKVINGPISGYPSVDPVNLICKASSSYYLAKNIGNVGRGIEYLIFYGGIAMGPRFIN